MLSFRKTFSLRLMLNDFGEMFDDLMLRQGLDGTTWVPSRVLFHHGLVRV